MAIRLLQTVIGRYCVCGQVRWGRGGGGAGEQKIPGRQLPPCLLLPAPMHMLILQIKSCNVYLLGPLDPSCF